MHPDGIFAIEYVPPGKYTLRVEALAFDETPPRITTPEETSIAAGLSTTSMSSISGYIPLNLPIIVAEHDVVVDDVLPVKSKPTEKQDAPQQ